MTKPHALARASLFARTDAQKRPVALLATMLLMVFAAGACTTQLTAKTSRVVAKTAAFDDEFNGSTLDLSKWQPNWLAGDDTSITKPVNGAEVSCYDPHQVTVSGGVLHLRIDQRACRANNGVTYGYASGLVNTRRHFTFDQGHLEARVWLSGTNGIENWPAVWTDGIGTWPQTGESDIMEGLSGNACWHYHSPSGGPGGCAGGYGTGWHTYAETVTPSATTYYFDGRQMGSLPSVHAPHFVILNLAAGSDGGPTAAPREMLVDYVRVTTN